MQISIFNEKICLNNSELRLMFSSEEADELILSLEESLNFIDGKEKFSIEHGHKVWRKNGKIHREEGPAIEYKNGNKEWYINGNWHRLDGPAVECIDGRRAWYLNGKRHRTDGPAVECLNGRQEWWFEGKLHRTDGPAMVHASGNQSWYFHGQRHRIDGPAVDYFTMDHKEWWVDGKQLTESAFMELQNEN